MFHIFSLILISLQNQVLNTGKSTNDVWFVCSFTVTRWSLQRRRRSGVPRPWSAWTLRGAGRVRRPPRQKLTGTSTASLPPSRWRPITNLQPLNKVSSLAFTCWVAIFLFQILKVQPIVFFVSQHCVILCLDNAFSSRNVSLCWTVKLKQLIFLNSCIILMFLHK